MDRGWDLGVLVYNPPFRNALILVVDTRTMVTRWLSNQTTNESYHSAKQPHNPNSTLDTIHLVAYAHKIGLFLHISGDFADFI